MTYEIVTPKQSNIDWIPGYGDVHSYKGAVSTGPQHLALEEEPEFPTIGQASRAWAKQNVAEELSPAQALIAWAFAV